MNPVRWLLSLCIVVPLASAGCRKASEDTKDKVYDIKGKVVALDRDKTKVTLDHEDIPGLMKAMKMPFSVEKAKMLEGIQPGDEVEGRLRVTSGDYIITELKKR